MRHRAVVGQGFHQRKRGAAGDRRSGQRQPHPQERAPRAQSQRARRFGQVGAAGGEGGAHREVNIRIKHEDEHQGRARQRAHFRKPVAGRLPAGAVDTRQGARSALYRPGKLQKIGVGVGDDISGQGQGQHEGRLQHAPARKFAQGREPRRADAHGDDAGAHQRDQSQRIHRVIGKAGGDEMGPRATVGYRRACAQPAGE